MNTTNVGEILRQARQKKRLSFEQVSQKTKIDGKYLQALEKGDYQVFASLAHLKGFLKIYLKFLGLREEAVMPFWRREYNQLTPKDLSQENAPPSPLKDRLSIFTPRFLSLAGAGLLACLFFAYLAFQYWRYSSPPKLLISSPSEDMIVDEAEIAVFGIASSDSQVTVNGETVVLGAGGEFLVKMPLSKGLNLLNIVAKNKLDKETKKTFKIVYEPPQPPPLQEKETVAPQEIEKSVDEQSAL